MSSPEKQGPLFGIDPETAPVELIRRRYPPEIAARDITQPFVVVDDSEVFTCTLLGRVPGQDNVRRPVTVRLQKDKPTPPPPSFGQSYTNQNAQSVFAEEADCLRQLGTGGEGIIPAVGDPGPLHSLPITYCKKIEAFFHPPCPDCGGWLVDCTDELFLGHLGLPTYATSHERFLWCPSCAANVDEEPVLYTLWRSRQSGNGVTLRFGSELYRAYTATVRRDEENLPEGLQQFPCQTCEFKSACYPQRVNNADAIPAEDFLYPVSYYEFEAILRESYELPYGEFARFLGGRNWSELSRIPEVTQASAEKKSERQAWYFWGNAPESRSALEVLWLKLGAFEQVMEGIRRVAEQCGRPHLGISPESIRVQPGRSSRWQFAVGLVDPAAARLAVLSSQEGAPTDPLYLPLGKRSDGFSAPQFSQAPFGQQFSANVKVVSAERQENAIAIEAEIVAEKLGDRAIKSADWLRVMIQPPTSRVGGVWLWLSNLQPTGGGFRGSGVSGSLRPGLAAEVAGLAGTTLWDCRVQLCRRYGEECDLASAGMVLLCSLLVNDEQDTETVTAAVRTISAELAQYGGSAPVTREQFRRILGEHEALFRPEAVFDRALDRRSATVDIPAELWEGCLAFGFSLRAGVMIARAMHAEMDTEITIKSSTEQLKALNLWAEGQLFARGALGRERDHIVRANG